MLEEFIGFLFRMIFAILFVGTGELILYVVTLGRHRPRLLSRTKESESRLFIFTELSLWVGMAFWLLVAVLVYRLLAMG
jgi:hypothetical protein